MGRKRSVVSLAVAVLVLALAGCAGDEGEDQRTRRAALDFSPAVERIGNDVTREATAAITALNEVADRTLQPRTASAALDRRADTIRSAAMRLGRLDAPAAVESTHQDLERALGDVGRNLESTASNIRLATRERGDPRDAANAGRRLISAGLSAARALSLALRSLVEVSVER